MKMANLYVRNKQIMIHSSSQTHEGLWIASAPYSVIDLDSDDFMIGKLVMEAIDSSKGSVPHPTNWAEVLKPILMVAKVKSWSAFAKDSKYFAIEKDDEGLHIVPHNNLGEEEGFEPIGKKITLPSSCPLSEIGNEVRRIIAL